MKIKPKNTTRIKAAVLQEDQQIIKDLIVALKDKNWTHELGIGWIMFQREERRVFYTRKSNILQLYWVGYGHMTIEVDLFKFNKVSDLLLLVDQLEELELVGKPREPDDLDDLDPQDIINSIFS